MQLHPWSRFKYCGMAKGQGSPLLLDQNICGDMLQVGLLGIESIALTCSAVWHVTLNLSIMHTCGRIPSRGEAPHEQLK